ncbi:MAG TPA: hypothetical protein VNN62_09695, partial [Methylomirabilota bacterium]|nr:hypothetical protein [Methylomirabilota bacterium]
MVNVFAQRVSAATTAQLSGSLGSDIIEEDCGGWTCFVGRVRRFHSGAALPLRGFRAGTLS